MNRNEAVGEARMKESEARANLKCAFVRGSTQSPTGSFVLYGGNLERQLYSLVFLSTKGIRNPGLHLLTSGALSGRAKSNCLMSVTKNACISDDVARVIRAVKRQPFPEE